jgi:four helix bundle protein
MQDFGELNVWVCSKKLAKEIYSQKSLFTKDQGYGIRSHIRRYDASVFSNISVASRWNSQKNFSYCLISSLGSLSELNSLVESASGIGVLL